MTPLPFSHKVLTYDQMKEKADQLHAQNKTIIMVSGCYDIVHLGHVQFLVDAKSRADILVVSVGSDAVIRTLKGPSRPVMNQSYRAAMLAALIPVDYVVIDEEGVQPGSRINFEQLVSLVRPQLFAVNNTDSSIPKKHALLTRYGVELVVVDVEKTAITSTTEIAEKIILRD